LPVAVEKRNPERKFKVFVEDVYIIPDYESWISPCIDKDFGRFAKEEWTKHQ
jgi:hypothetical protein